MSQHKDQDSWSLDKSFELSCPYQNLNSTFFSVFVFDGKTNEKVSEVAIDYYMLAIGPHHFDIQLRALRSSKTLGRLSFNVEFANFDRMSVSLRNVRCRFFHPETVLCKVSFRTISTNETEESVQSQAVFSQYDNGGQAIEWNFSHLQHKPEVEMDLTFQQLRLSSFQMLIWKQETSTRAQSPLLGSRGTVVKSPAKKLSSGHEESKQNFQRSATIKRASLSRPDALAFYRIDSMVSDRLDLDKVKSEYAPAGEPSMFSSSTELPRTLSFSKQERRVSYKKEPDLGGSGSGAIFTLQLNPVDHMKQDELGGECYISFQKLLQDQVKLFDRKDSSFLSSAVYEQSEHANQQYQNAKKRSSLRGQEELLSVLGGSGGASKGQRRLRKLLKRFQQSLWLSGQVIGTLTGSLEIANTPFLHQMMFGVCTEHGVKIASVSVLNDTSWFERISTKKEAMQLPDKIKELFRMKQDLMRYHQRGKLPMKSRPSVNYTESVLQDMVDLLGESDKTSMVSFFYQNESALLQAQQLLIELGFHFLEFSDFVRYQFRNLYFFVLERLFKRGELDLSMMKYQHFSEQANSDIQRKITNSSKFLEEKNKTSLLYSRLLYKALGFVLQKLTRKGVDKVQREFLETFLSISFFRIPAFRQRFLDSITDKPFSDLPEYEPVMPDSHAPLSRLFDWNGFFYSHLPKNQENAQAQENLGLTLDKVEWRARLAKRGVAFFLIVQKWAQYVQKYTVRQHLPWNDIPGYSEMVKAILSEMKTREVLHYPDALVQTTVVLLSNDQLLSVFVMIILKKTNAYDSYTVATTIEILNRWFQAIKEKNRLLPSYFDFRFFFEAIDILLHLDHAISTSKCLWLLYNSFTLFPPEQRNQISSRLLKKSMFVDLAYHWSWHVRNILIHIIIYFLENKYNYHDADSAIHLWFDPVQGASPPKRGQKQQNIKALTQIIECYSKRILEVQVINGVKAKEHPEIFEQQSRELPDEKKLYAGHFYRRYKEVQHLHEEWSKKGESELPNIDIRLPIDDVDGIDDW